MKQQYLLHKKLFITLDAISVLAQVYFLIWPFLAYYLHQPSYNKSGKWPLVDKLMIIDITPLLFSAVWLEFRFYDFFRKEVFRGYTVNMIRMIILLSWGVFVGRLQPYQN